jgi:hypothetical protein
MSDTVTMHANFESQKNKKALAITAGVLGGMLLLAILVSWQLPSPPVPVAQDFIEINLGNDIEGFGKVQPLVKGEKAPSVSVAEQPRRAAAANTKTEDIKTDENTDKESAPVTKPVKTTVKVATPAPVVVPEPKPQKPKIAGYNGPKSGTGNGATEDNGYRYQGNNPGGKGDAGSPNGKPDSYGNSPGGKTGGGPRVTNGDRKIIRYYSFTGDLDKATIYAVIKVSPEGKGQFAGFGKNSTSRSPTYANAISEYLANIQFDKSDHASDVTVQFNFTVN